MIEISRKIIRNKYFTFLFFLNKLKIISINIRLILVLFYLYIFYILSFLFRYYGNFDLYLHVDVKFINV